MNVIKNTLIWLFSISCLYPTISQDTMVLKTPGLIHPVTINTDQWGVAHIYASNEKDLFFAQGFQAAKDRLFQFEIFRRQATGTLAEVMGEKELNRDIGARLFKFRGDLKKEMIHYHHRGEVIITSFVRGINAYIQLVLDGTEKMPIELEWLGIKPGFWTPEVVLSRHNGLLSNVQTELQTARIIAQLGASRTAKLMNYHPRQPSLLLDSILTKEALAKDILKLYNAFRKRVSFTPEDILLGANHPDRSVLFPEYHSDKRQEGSNNWVISGDKTFSGYPIMANDPHRSITVPSLRYLIHLQAPGWNVIGGGEPILPGVSIGHNEYGAWGLTIFDTDMEDLYVYKTNPNNSNQYWHDNRWQTFKKIEDRIEIKNSPSKRIEHFYSIHGPVCFRDTLRNLAYAVRCAWLESGCAPYLASLRMNQARDWTEFKEACKYSFVPAENMVWADRKGNIGWQAVGIAPIRNQHSGMVPVSGDGHFEWSGYLPIHKRPGVLNPKKGFIATANQNLTEATYRYMNSIGYQWADPYRGDRINEVLGTLKKFDSKDMQSLQTDYTALPARVIIPWITGLEVQNQEIAKMQKELSAWDQVLSPTSGMAGLYMLTERYLETNLLQTLLPENQDAINSNDIGITSLSTTTIIHIMSPESNTLTQKLKDEILLNAFSKAIQDMKSIFGTDISRWQYGHEQLKHVSIIHPLAPGLSDSTQKILNIRTAPRGGYGNTVGSTGDGNNQTQGASFRIIVDCADWDLTKTTNTPGQSGDPANRHYRDLFELWSKDEYFPLYFSKNKINSVTEKIVKLSTQ